jgi:hypothetical protein
MSPRLATESSTSLCSWNATHREDEAVLSAAGEETTTVMPTVMPSRGSLRAAVMWWWVAQAPGWPSEPGGVSADLNRAVAALGEALADAPQDVVVAGEVRRVALPLDAGGPYVPLSCVAHASRKDGTTNLVWGPDEY